MGYVSCEPAPELSIPDLIRSRRKSAGFSSQEALGRALGTTRIHVNAWETGRNLPSMKYAEKLATVLGGETHEYMAHDGHGPKRRGEDALAQRLDLLAEQMQDTNREILRLLTEIRNQIVQPLSPADDGSR